MMSNIRPSGRAHDQLRPVSFIRNYTHHAEGSVLACFGETKVLCTASISETLPRFLQNSHQGWLTAEYGMLPRSTHERIDREAAHGKQKGRTIEIQRLIGRALRAGIDLKALGPRMIVIDCDVIQADGGTRTAAISGACVALVDALNFLVKQGRLNKIPLRHLIAAVSVGIYNQTPILDLEYREDSKAHTDMNIVMTETGHFVELQGTAENQTFSTEELNILLELGRKGTNEIIQAQKKSLGLSYSIINGA